MPAPAIIWFRRDLRLSDQPAVRAAVEQGGAVLPVFIWSPEEEGDFPVGAAGRWWLHQSLAALDSQLRQRGGRLLILRGRAGPTLTQLARQTRAAAVYWTRRYEPAARRQERAVEGDLRKAGVAFTDFAAGLLREPWELGSRSGRPFQVFTPFWKTLLASLPGVPLPQPLPAPPRLELPSKPPRSLKLDDLALLPKVDWAGGLRQTWQAGEVAAARKLEQFVEDKLQGYASQRDFPAAEATSRLSPHLAWGEISPGQVWQRVAAAAQERPERRPGAEKFLAELGWREFAGHVLYHFPHTARQPLREKFARFPWRRGGGNLTAWEQGRTGYPLVDAAMRQLWQTGWMHNRLRMVVASFLVKDQLIRWQAGAAWFWETLVDADLANNTLGWQWAAGCGADAAPYFRIFNPVEQSRRYDPDGHFLRHWLPELAALPNRWLHCPWQAPPDTLAAAGVQLGGTYPQPIVDHAQARTAALAAFAEIRGH